MRIKRYVADNMQQAVAMVKADFGDEAVILHTKRFRRGGFFGLFGRPKVEVVAAIEPGKGPRNNRRQRELQEARDNTAETLASLHEEVRSLKHLLGEQDGPVAAAWPAAAREALDRLRHQEIPEADALDFVGRVVDGAAPTEAEDGAWVRERLIDELAAAIPTAPLWEFAKKPRIIPLIGPTGVGKTTTIAKLAANYSMVGEHDVGLITADTYRIAAVEQLRTYANIIGIELHVAYTPEELAAAVEELSDCELILIDTAGRSQSNAMHMAELRAFLDVLPEHETHLVMSATTRHQDMLDIAERFAPTDYAGIIVTKLDETDCHGHLYTLPRSTERPLVYLTNGQSVPDDIELATSERAARLIVGEAG